MTTQASASTRFRGVPVGHGGSRLVWQPRGSGAQRAGHFAGSPRCGRTARTTTCSVAGRIRKNTANGCGRVSCRVPVAHDAEPSTDALTTPIAVGTPLQPHGRTSTSVCRRTRSRARILSGVSLTVCCDPTRGWVAHSLDGEYLASASHDGPCASRIRDPDRWCACSESLTTASVETGETLSQSADCGYHASAMGLVACVAEGDRRRRRRLALNGVGQ